MNCAPGNKRDIVTGIVTVHSLQHYLFRAGVGQTARVFFAAMVIIIDGKRPVCFHAEGNAFPASRQHGKIGCQEQNNMHYGGSFSEHWYSGFYERERIN